MIEFREMRSSDIPFLCSSYLKSYRNSNDTKNIRSTIYYKFQKTEFLKLLNRSSVIIAIEPGVDYHIIGYIIYDLELNALHYVYVKHALRNFGVAKKLVTQSQLDLNSLSVTHVTDSAVRVLSKYRTIDYNPYLK